MFYSVVFHPPDLIVGNNLLEVVKKRIFVFLKFILISQEEFDHVDHSAKGNEMKKTGKIMK